MGRSRKLRVAGRGGRKRKERARREARNKALSWWKEPGVLAFLAVLALAGAGIAMVVQAIDKRPVKEATLGGLSMKMVEARWLLDQMDHGENFQKPSTMMPDMPEWGKQRVSLDLTVRNVSDRERLFKGEEFELVPELGDPVPPMGAQTGRARLAPGQTFNTVVHFDFDTTEPHGKLRVAWERDDERVYFPIPEPAEHYHLRPRGGEVALPRDARLVLPIGKPDRGEILYKGKFGCTACHGDPALPDSNIIGPHLGNIGLEGASRVEGKSSAQYIYESILEPGGFIAPECQNGQPCSEPTAMPEYASLVSLEDVAHIVAYLIEQKNASGQ